MKQRMVKVKIPLPENDPSGGEAEWLWAEPEANGTFTLKNVPTFAKGLSYGDAVDVRMEGGIPTFVKVAKRGGHSTYRVYAKTSRHNPSVEKVLSSLEVLGCDLEPATDRIVNVDVLPGSDIYAVYKVMDTAEQAGLLEFEEGHCGHKLQSGQ